ncbi:hypothetical protein TB1_008598 [Malus domestica]
MSGAILNNINTRLDTRTVSVLLRHSEAISLFPLNTLSPRLVLIAHNSSAPLRAAPLDHLLCTYEDLVDKGDEGFKWVPPSNEWDPMTATSSREEGVRKAIEEVVVDGGVGFQTTMTNSSNRHSYSVGSSDYIVDEEESEVMLSNAEREGAGCRGMKEGMRLGR